MFALTVVYCQVQVEYKEPPINPSQFSKDPVSCASSEKKIQTSN